MHKGFVTPGQVVNDMFYCDVLRCLRENVRNKLPEMWKIKTWLLHKEIPSSYNIPIVPTHPTDCYTIFAIGEPSVRIKGCKVYRSC